MTDIRKKKNSVPKGKGLLKGNESLGPGAYGGLLKGAGERGMGHEPVSYFLSWRRGVEKKEVWPPKPKGRES